MNIKIPEGAARILSALAQNGFEAYVVGGCVRDSLCGLLPQDWDICTNAKPEQVKNCFAPDVQIIETGIRHGTVTVMMEREPYEVTTYRVDGAYSDNRHPSSVAFVSSLREDLARRDFTVNAMAYHPEKGLVDYFHGCEDLQRKQLQCVGNPDERFREDALRMMRGLRFAATYGFEIAAPTQRSLRKHKELLRHISAERLNTELCKLLCGPGAAQILTDYAEVLCVFIPEFLPMLGFLQHNPYHALDVWQHTAQSVASAPANVILRLTMLLHDLAKPSCYGLDEQGIGHFYGHPQHSAELAEVVLKRLKFDSDTITQVSALIFYHDVDLQPRNKHIKRWLNKLGEARLRQLIQVQRADILAQNVDYRLERLQRLEAVSGCIDEIIEQRQCFCLKDLAVNGRDLMELGLTDGLKIGDTLKQLMNLVLDNQLENDREVLLEAAKRGFVTGA